MSSHHINGNFNDSRSFNRISLCKACHDVVQAVCDECSNQLNCHVKCFQECWLFDSGLPPIHFQKKIPLDVPNQANKPSTRGRKRLGKPIWECRSILSLINAKFKVICLVDKIHGSHPYPCVYRFEDGCTIDPENRSNL